MSIKLLSQVWQHKTTGNERATLQVLCDYANDDGICWPSNDIIAWKVGVSGRQIRSIMQDLRSRGVITVLESGGKGPGSTNRIMINLDEIPTKPPFHPGNDDTDDNPDATENNRVVLSPKGEKAEAPEHMFEYPKGEKAEVWRHKPEVQTSAKPSSLEPSDKNVYDGALPGLQTSTPFLARNREANPGFDDDPLPHEATTVGSNQTTANKNVGSPPGASGGLLGKTNSTLSEANDIVSQANNQPDSNTRVAQEAKPDKLYTVQDYLREFCRLAGLERVADKESALKDIKKIINFGVKFEELESYYNSFYWATDGINLSLMAQPRWVDKWRSKNPPSRKEQRVNKDHIRTEDLPLFSAERMKRERRIPS